MGFFFLSFFLSLLFVSGYFEISYVSRLHSTVITRILRINIVYIPVLVLILRISIDSMLEDAFAAESR